MEGNRIVPAYWPPAGNAHHFTPILKKVPSDSPITTAPATVSKCAPEVQQLPNKTKQSLCSRSEEDD